MLNVTPELIFQTATGFMAAKHLFVANEIGLFEQLAKGAAGLDELSKRNGVPRRIARGDVYSVDEARSWLHDSGWRMLEHRPLLGPLSLIVAEAAP